MAIRERLRKTFGKKNSSSSGGSTPSTSSDPAHYTGRTDIEYYKPNEIPKSKYKGKVDPGHKEKLEAYSFSDAFSAVRRKSSQAFSGIMSPGGTKSQSRRASYISNITNDGARTPATLASKNPMSRAGSTYGPPRQLILENSDDDTDPKNVPVSRPTMSGQHGPRGAVPDVRLERQATVPDQPFTAEELEQAMTRATLQSNDDGVLRPNMAVAAH